MTTRAALYLDFDNVFSSLHVVDPDSAFAFAEDPRRWLVALTTAHLTGGPRRWLVLRCYMNPVGRVQQSGNAGGRDRRYFSRFRTAFVSAGFEVIDCPPLTTLQKNAADLRMALDMVDALNADVRYDEFVLCSGDSDFTPVLLRLRAGDRRATVLSAGPAAAAFTSLATKVIGAESMLDLVQGPDPAVDSAAEAGPAPTASTNDVSDDLESRFASFVEERYEVALEPIPLSRLAAWVDTEVGSGCRQTRWFGHGTFSRALASVRLDGAELTSHWLWDPRRHDAPVAVAAGSEAVAQPADSRRHPAPGSPTVAAGVRGPRRLRRDAPVQPLGEHQVGPRRVDRTRP